MLKKDIIPLNLMLILFAMVIMSSSMILPKASPDASIILKSTPKVLQTIENGNINHNFVALSSVSYPSTRGITIGKCNPDGVTRIILGTYPVTNSKGRILKRVGSSFEFELEAELDFPHPFNNTYQPVLVYDFDSDGIDEVFGNLNNRGSFVGWNGTGYSFKWENIGSQIFMSDGAPQIHDIDRDGLPELITNTRGTTYVYSWENGSLKIDATLDGGAWFDVGIGDIDSDGEDEIITNSNPEIRIFGYNNGAYEEEYHGEFSEKDYSAFSLVDIDNDGAQEIITGMANVDGVPNYPITLFEWNSNSLESYTLMESPSAHFDIHAGDIDGDGLAEVLLEGNGDQFTVVEQASNESIIVQDYSMGVNLFFRLFDIDGDYIPELISTDLIYTDYISVPPALSSPPDLSFEINSPNQILSWITIDRNASTYEIFINEMSNETGTWVSGIPINFTLDGLPQSTYNFTVKVWDLEGFFSTDTVWVVVTPPDLTPPTIMNVYHEPTVPTVGDMVSIYADITDLSGIWSVLFSYRVNRSDQWYGASMIIDTGYTYRISIGFPFAKGGTVIEYLITATDNSINQNIAINDNNGKYYSYTISALTSEAKTSSSSQEIPTAEITSFQLHLFDILFISLGVIFIRKKICLR